MTNELKQKYLDQYNALELLADAKLLKSEEYERIEHTLLRTIIGHFAIECNKAEENKTNDI